MNAEKTFEINKKFDKIFNKIGYAWHGSGENFISYEVYSKDIKKIQQKIYEIAKNCSFYVCPDLMVYEHKIVVCFNF